jgi:hypothetical protein
MSFFKVQYELINVLDLILVSILLGVTVAVIIVLGIYYSFMTNLGHYVYDLLEPFGVYCQPGKVYVQFVLDPKAMEAQVKQFIAHLWNNEIRGKLLTQTKIGRFLKWSKIVSA